ncbi:MAG: sugar ABC transporter permease [Chloroflexi bacterium]|nr:sugar ABC transporter permease [Chloroflexota bacterium]
MSSLSSRVLPRQNPVSDEVRRTRQQKVFLITFFFLPGFVMLFLFILAPVGQAGYYSLYKWNGLGPLQNFVGFGNYERALTHQVFQGALLHNLIIMVLSLSLQLPLALFLALLLVRGRLRFQRLWRAILFIPFVFSEPVVAYIWLFVYHPQSGLVNTVFSQLIPSFENQAWLGNQSTVLTAAFFVITWKYFGLHMLLYMAGLQNLNTDIEDAARVDGANERQVMRFVTLPMMLPTIQLSAFLSILGSLQQFGIILLMTKGGPAYSSELIVTYIYKFGLQRLNLGYGAAASVILFLIALLFSIGYQRTIMRVDNTM